MMKVSLVTGHSIDRDILEKAETLANRFSFSSAKIACDGVSVGVVAEVAKGQLGALQNGVSALNAGVPEAQKFTLCR